MESLKEDNIKAMLDEEPDQAFVDEVNEIATGLEIDMTGIDMKQLRAGMEVEKEHAQDNDVKVAMNHVDLLKIAVAHLRENEEYYTVLLNAGL